jgi:hypothetical protein
VFEGFQERKCIMFQNGSRRFFNGSRLTTLLRRQERTARRDRRYWPTLEALENRLVPVVGGPANAPAVIAGANNGLYDGVVQITNVNSLNPALGLANPVIGSGELLTDGTDILTAGHVLNSFLTPPALQAALFPSAQRVGFDLRRTDGPGGAPINRTININVPVGAGFQTTAPGAIVPARMPFPNDLAILRLTDQVNVNANRRMVAPYYSPNIGYSLFNGNPAGGQVFTLVGYGYTGTGAGGFVAGTAGTKRMGANMFDAPASILNNEVQTVGVTGAPTAGNFTLTITLPGGAPVTTGNILFNASANVGPASVQARLRAVLPAALQNGVQVFGGPGIAAPGDATTWFISFTGPLASTNVAQVTMNNVNLVGGAVRAGTTRFQGGANEQQNISFAGPPTGGTFTLTFTPRPGPLGIAPAAVTTDPIAWNANANILAANVQAALQRATNPMGAALPNVQVTGGPAAGTVTVTFINQLANTAQNLLAANGARLTGAGAAVNPPARTMVAAAPQAPGYGDFAYDFDNGNAANAAFGLFYGINQNGATVPVANGGPDVMQSGGDSGGPAFINGQIAGVVSYSRPLRVRQVPDIDDTPNNSYGEMGVMVQPALFANSFINPTIGGNYDLVLDMNFQMLGVDGTNDPITITASRGGGAGNPNLTLTVTDPNSRQYSGTYFTGLAANIRSLTIRGTAGNDTIDLIGALGVGPITIDGRGGNNRIEIGDAGTGNLNDVTDNIIIDGGGGGTNTLEVNDVAGRGRTYTLTANTLTWGAASNIRFAHINNLTLNAGNGNNIENVQATNAGTSTTINTGSVRDTVNVGSTNDATSTLNNIRGDLVVQSCGGGNTTLNANDQAAAAGQTYVVTRTSITRAGIGTIFFCGITGLNVNGAGASTYNIQGTPAGAATAINARAGNNVINVGSAANTVNDIDGSLSVNGQGANNRLNYNDQGTTVAKNYLVRSTSINRNGSPLVIYGGMQTVVLKGGSGGNTVAIQSTAAGATTWVNSGTGDDTVTVVSGAPNPNRIDDIQGTLVIDTQGGANTNDRIFINDSGNRGPHRYRTTSAWIQRVGGPTIYTQNYKSRTLTGAPGSCICQVLSNPIGTFLTVNGGGDGDTFLVGDDSNTLNDVQGTVVFNAGGSNDLVQFNDQGYSGGDQYTIGYNTATVGRLPSFNVTFNGMHQLALNSGAGNDIIILNNPSPSQALLIDAGAGYDSVIMAAGVVTNPQLANVEALQITGGTFSLDNSLSIQDFIQSGGTLTGTGTLMVTGTGSWSGGTMSGTGLTLLAAGATLTVNGAGLLLDTRTLENDGTLTWSFSGAGVTGTGTIDNVGLFAGPGNFRTGNVVNEGQIYPGGNGGIGTLAVNGNFTQTATGVLSIDLGGPTPGTQFDQLTVTTLVALDGTLNVNILPSFQGNSFRIIDNTGPDFVHGTFAGLPEGAIVNAGGRQFQITYLGGDGNDVVLTLMSSLTLVSVASGLDSPIAVDYHELTNSLIVSVHYPSGQPHNFEQLLADGTVVPFSDASGFTDEVLIAAVRAEDLGAFTIGDLFVGNGQPGEIVRLTEGGNAVINPWVVLPGAQGLLHGGLTFDRTGVFGGDLIAVTTSGEVWRVNAAGTPILLANVGALLEGVTVVPNDAARYGPLAGKIVAPVEDSSSGGLYTIDPQGQTAFYDLGIQELEDIRVIPANQNFYGVDFGSGRVVGAAAADFAGLVGDLLLVQETPTGSGLYRLRWDGTTVRVEPLTLSSSSAAVSQWEHITFAPAAIGGLQPQGGGAGPVSPGSHAGVDPTAAFTATANATSLGAGMPTGIGISLDGSTPLGTVPPGQRLPYRLPAQNRVAGAETRPKSLDRGTAAPAQVVDHVFAAWALRTRAEDLADDLALAWSA